MREFRKKIQGYLDRGESVQIVAPPGFGKSRFGNGLGGLFLDTNLLQTPDELLAAVKTSPERELIVIDSLDKILSADYEAFFSYLKGLRDSHKYQLVFVFLTDKLIGPQYLPILGNLYQLVSEHIERLPTIDESEYDTFGFSPTRNQIKEITSLSGGIPALVKTCMISLRDKIPLDPTSHCKSCSSTPGSYCFSRPDLPSCIS
ncbi:hypothetical protein HYS03_00175 [Candidatus Woesebacteria bacterium]|nr:hypothetical protein [Candidatus Woesebacteria bacterium]